MLLKTLLICLVARETLACRSKVDHASIATTESPQNDQPTTASSGQPSKDGPLVVTPAGAIRGSWMETRRGRQFKAFRGIRYAEPPVGELRFKPPVPILKYTNEVNASEEGPACPLPVPPTYYIDEDCLTINVYTPNKNSSKPLPVIFFIHAGGFYSMTGRSDLAGPHYLLDRDIVLVTINYRLATLGFLSTGDALAPGNNGYKDQVVALRWVQRNIRAFGGDPDLVTIAGCSAGSFSVMLHMISPMTKGLFHRAISISGSPINQLPDRNDLYSLAVTQAELVGCPTNNSKAIIDCLKTKPFRELGDSLPGFFNQFYDPTLLWSPVVELDFGQERYLDMKPIDAVRQGRMHAVPYIISQTHDEFFWKAFPIVQNKTLRDTMNSEWDHYAPISFQLAKDDTAVISAHKLRQAYLKDTPIAENRECADGLGKLYADALIGFGVHRLANLMCRHSPHKVYYYQFAYVGNHSHYEDPVTNKSLAASHHDDLIYLFTLSYRFPTIEVSDSTDSLIVDRMTAVWFNFAKYGDPNPRGNELPELSTLQWPAMTPTAPKYLKFDKQFSIEENMFEDRFNVWEELYSIQY
ncbi:carboxylic ester hydrolase-like [Achroia grisella]|uniref:carboxylic ester hydrolase-like n=1 Tax=Achroia grisella TaxID=688607 RepID=UPI0027D29670|nr:carboxylic ester hydrolase-like [Achroia grisella]